MSVDLLLPGPMPSGTQGLNPKFFLLCVTHFNQGVVIGKKESPPASPNKCGGDVKLQWKCVACVTLLYTLVKLLHKKGFCVLGIPEETAPYLHIHRRCRMRAWAWGCPPSGPKIRTTLDTSISGQAGTTPKVRTPTDTASNRAKDEN